MSLLKISIVAISICASLFVCVLARPKKHQAKSDHELLLKLEGEIIAMDTSSVSLTDPRQLFLLDDTLMIIHNWPFGENVFTIADVKNQKILGHYLKEGIFGESGVSPHKSMHKRRIEAAGFGWAKVIDVDSMLANRENTTRDIVNLPKNEFLRTDFTDDSYQVTSLWNLNDSLFIASGLFPFNKRLGLCNSKGEILSTFFNYPDTAINVSSKIKSTAYTYLFMHHPTKNMFVMVCYESDWIEIMKLVDNKVVSVHSSFTYLPKYQVVDVIAQSSITNKQGNFAADVTGRLIYILRSSRTINESIVNGKISWQTNDVYVYTWTGKLLARLQLDEQVSGLCVDNSDQTLYAFTKNDIKNTVKLIKYQLPRSLSNGLSGPGN